MGLMGKHRGSTSVPRAGRSAGQMSGAPYLGPVSPVPFRWRVWIGGGGGGGAGADKWQWIIVTMLGRWPGLTTPALWRIRANSWPTPSSTIRLVGGVGRPARLGRRRSTGRWVGGSRAGSAVSGAPGSLRWGGPGQRGRGWGPVRSAGEELPQLSPAGGICSNLQISPVPGRWTGTAPARPGGPYIATRLYA